MALFCVFMAAINLATAAADLFPTTVTNLTQLSTLIATNAPLRQLVPVRLLGTVQVGGSFGSMVLIEGSPSPVFLPTAISGNPLQRGQLIQIKGQCLVEGANLLFEPHPLIDDDGTHMMLEQSARLWLEAGRQPICVRYFNGLGARGLDVSIEGPGMPRHAISDSMLWHRETNHAFGATYWTNGLSFKCYEGQWTRLPDFSAMNPVAVGVASNFDISVAHRTEFFGLEFSGFIEIPRAGFYSIYCASDDGSQVALGEVKISVAPIGKVALSELPQLAAGQLIGGTQNAFCASLDGVVNFAARDGNELKLELAGGRGRAAVRVRYSSGVDPQWLVGARVSASGVCQAVFTPEGNLVAGQLTVSSMDNVRVRDVSKRFWDSQPILDAARVAEMTSTNREPQLVHLRGTLVPTAGRGAPPGEIYGLKTDAGELALQLNGAQKFEPGARIEALGVASIADRKLLLHCYALRKLMPARAKPSRELPELTTVEEVKQMSRQEANLGYPVNVRGVITFAWPDGGFFLEDGTWSIDVRMAGINASGVPQIGDFWDVQGYTFAEFAPDILATRAVRVGAGALPQPEHPSWTQLVDGSMDTQYIEVQGVVVGANGTVLDLLMRGGRLKVELPEMSAETLTNFQGALVRVRGCLIPGRDVVTQHVKVGEFALRNASVAVDQPAPADPFALPLKHATDLLLFESHASPIERARIGGIVLQQRGGMAFLMDRTNGVRVVTGDAVHLLPGDQVDAVGFPDLTGPSPLLNNAVVRRLGHDLLPEPARLTADQLTGARNDSTFVVIEGTLVSQRNSGDDRIMEMRSGARLWLARLPMRGEKPPALALGSVLDLTGVYVGRGSDQARGRDIDSFELLLNGPEGVHVLRRPSWWTVRHALLVAGVLLAVLLFALAWIGVLRRQVDDRMRALKNEIEDHKRTESELEKKTRQLTQEIEERLRIEAEVERGHKQLLLTSRLAGMAEVATSVLHNVGNVMTSVNVLSNSIVDIVRNSKVSSVTRLSELLGKNRGELGRFVTDDERGRKMPDYIRQLSEHLADEQAQLLQKVNVLNENIHHINEIVAMQQSFAKVSGVLETVPPAEVLEDALRMLGDSLKRHAIKLVREFQPLPAMTMDRHKVLQILFNLLENAKYACLHGRAPEKEIIVRLQRHAEFMRLEVADNGMGILAENLERIFAQGFSTRKDGHGFGLHSSVLAAQDMGGSLTARSDGRDQGATFVLEIPMAPINQT